MQNGSFAQRLTEALGPDTALTHPDDIAPWLSDWRGIYRGQAQAVLRPRSVDEVARALALCQQAAVPVVPRGGNTGLCGGATPDAHAHNVVLSLDRMNAVRSLDTIANTMVAEAGCILGNLRRAAQDANRLLPLSLAAEDSCQIGGNLATNAGGVNVVRYGMTRELVLGVEAVLPNGEVFHGLRTLRKDNTGYDLKQLLIGSEGTLGVITAAALRLFPRTDTRSVVLAAVASPRSRWRSMNCCSSNAAHACRPSSSLPVIAWTWCSRMRKACRNRSRSAIRAMCWWNWPIPPMRQP
ncbi:protein of unknown function [Cupriavidus taiwanensis]|nr:protein of unknown function [Cupriavidus taiwanensis]